VARISIDVERRLGRVDRRIFGSFIEHLGRCIYGGVYEPGSPLSDERGFRRDVLDAARNLRIPVLRWPGGNFVSGYHWTDGVGPVAQRPRRLELAWQAEEPNQFGTDEFIRYCRALGAEPYICVNMGSGSMEEAAAWVEYCNSAANTHWANVRRANASEAAYGVKLWGLGNEMYGAWQIGATSAEDYVRKARQFAAVMLLVDPTIELVSCGQWGWTEWDRIVLDGLADLVRYHSIHLYTGSPDYYANVLAPHQADRALRFCEALIERVRFMRGIEHRIGIAYDEWNVWYRMRGSREQRNGLEERYDLSDALAIATYLNIFIRHCRAVDLANYAQMVNVIAPIFTRPAGLFLQTVYHPLRLYAEHIQPVALDAMVDSPRLQLEPAHLESITDLAPFDALDVSATCDEAGRELCIAVVNRHRDQAVSARVELQGRGFDGPVSLFEVNADDVAATNSFEAPERVVVREQRREASAGNIELAFPAHSLTLVRGHRLAT
jgi:alpha-N-arabinofuranosidase